MRAACRRSDLLVNEHQSRFHAERQPRHEHRARRRRPGAAQFGHRRHPRLAGRAGALRAIGSDDRNDHAVLQQRRDLLAAAFLRKQSLAGIARHRADGARAAAGRRPDLSRSADRRRLLPLHPPRADRCDRDVRSGVWPGLRRGKRFVHARRGCRLPQRAVRGRVRPAPGRQLVRRQARRSGRAQHADPARTPSAVSRPGARLHRRRSGAPVARAGAVAVPGPERAGAAECCM